MFLVTFVILGTARLHESYLAIVASRSLTGVAVGFCMPAAQIYVSKSSFFIVVKNHTKWSAPPIYLMPLGTQNVGLWEPRWCQNGKITLFFVVSFFDFFGDRCWLDYASKIGSQNQPKNLLKSRQKSIKNHIRFFIDFYLQNGATGPRAPLWRQAHPEGPLHITACKHRVL